MFNFYVDLVGHDIVTDTGKATTCGCKFKAPWLETKSTKNEGNLKTWVLTENNLKSSDEKKTFLASPRQPHELYDPYLQELTTDLVTRKKKTAEKLKKSIQFKTGWTLQD